MSAALTADGKTLLCFEVPDNQLTHPEIMVYNPTTGEPTRVGAHFTEVGTLTHSHTAVGML